MELKRKSFLTVSMVKQWSRQRGYGVSTLGDIQTLTGQDLEQPAPAHLVWARGWTKRSPGVPSSLSILVICELRTGPLLQESPADLSHGGACSYLTALWYRAELCLFSHRRETEALCCRSDVLKFSYGVSGRTPSCQPSLILLLSKCLWISHKNEG